MKMSMGILGKYLKVDSRKVCLFSQPSIKFPYKEHEDDVSEKGIRMIPIFAVSKPS
jgi:hypothetical protein